MAVKMKERAIDLRTKRSDNEIRQDVGFVAEVLLLVSVTVMLTLRDVSRVPISKAVFVAVIGVLMLAMPIERAVCAAAFLMPLYVGLPSNFITVIVLVRLLLSSRRARLGRGELLLCLVAGAFLILRALPGGAFVFSSAVFCLGMLFNTSIFAFRGRFDRRRMILCYMTGVTVLGLVMLFGTLRVYSFSELMSVACRLGDESAAYMPSGTMCVSMDPNFYGMFAVSSIALGLKALLDGELNGSFALPAKLLTVFNMLACGAVAFIGLSRSFVLVLAITVIAFLLTGKSLRRTLIGAGALTAVGVISVAVFHELAFAILKRFVGSDMLTGNGRLGLWLGAIRGWVASPVSFLFGTGIFACPGHSTPLQLLCGGGVVFTAIFTAYCFLTFGRIKLKVGGVRESLRRLIPVGATLMMSVTLPALALVNCMFPLTVTALLLFDELPSDRRLSERIDARVEPAFRFFGRCERYARRKLRAAAELTKYYLLHPVAYVALRGRKIYLIAERGDDARDNGAYMFRYIRTHRPQTECYYVIDRSSPDLDRVSGYGNVVARGSLRHYLLFIAADLRMSTHVMGFAPDRNFYAFYTVKHPMRRGKNVFLQHGITKDAARELFADRTHADLFICGAAPEYDFVRGTFGYPEGAVKYTGFARFDGLCDAKVSRTVLVMPTWRKFLSGMSREQFAESEYFRRWNGLLNDGRLLSALRESDVRLIFYPHYEVQPYLDLFISPSDRVVLADAAHYDVQTLLRESALLVTDYSSVFFDFAYMGKPVVHYFFDEEKFYAEHYSRGYFDLRRDGFGAVTAEQEELTDALIGAVENGFSVGEVYSARVERFFPLRDRNNCERILAEAEALL